MAKKPRKPPATAVPAPSSLSRCADTRERSSTNIYVAAGAG